MTLVVTLSDFSRPRVPLFTVPGIDRDAAIEAAVAELEWDTGLIAVDWELV